MIRGAAHRGGVRLEEERHDAVCALLQAEGASKVAIVCGVRVVLSWFEVKSDSPVLLQSWNSG